MDLSVWGVDLSKFPWIAALWLGILTSITPCPLATNIAAMSFIGKTVTKPRSVMISGLLYTLGRVLAYVALGIIATKGLMEIPGVSRFLERYMNLMIGPLLIVVSLFLLEVVSFVAPGISSDSRLHRWAAKSRFAGPVLLGVIFALTLCPVSAGLFFGSLMLQFNSGVLLPSIFGVGTGLPVIGFALVIAFSAKSIGQIYNRLSQFEYWARRVTGGIFLLAGLFLIYRNFSGYLRLFGGGE